MEELEGGHIYLALGQVLINVALVLESEANIQLPVFYEAGISDPKIGERLANQPYSVLNYAVSFLTSTWGNGPSPVFPSEGVGGG